MNDDGAEAAVTTLKTDERSTGLFERERELDALIARLVEVRERRPGAALPIPSPTYAPSDARPAPGYVRFIVSTSRYPMRHCGARSTASSPRATAGSC